MSPILLLPFLFLTIQADDINVNKAMCNGVQTNFDIKSIIGYWYVMSVVPTTESRERWDNIPCYKVEFSETEEAGLRWLVNNTLESEMASNMVGRIKEGMLVRQRYFSEQPFDIWSKAVDGVNGCFQQVLTLDLQRSPFSEGITNDAMMQLHIIENGDPKKGIPGPILVQKLFGKVLTAVIYRREKDVDPDSMVNVIVDYLSKTQPIRFPYAADCY